MKICSACLIGAVVATKIFPNNYILGLLLGALVALITFGLMKTVQILILNLRVNRLHYKKRMLGFALEAESTLQKLIEFKKVSIELEKTQKKLIEL